MSTWHAEVPPMLAWMTNTLVGAVAVNQANSRRAALAKEAKRAAAAKRQAKTASKKSPATSHPTPKR